VVELVYGMGFVTVTPRSFGPSGLFKDSVNFLQALTELGFIGIVMDGRGTPGRSKQFQDVTYLNLGQYEIADHAGALKQLARIRPYMDMSRVGIFGNSYGGYLSLRALLQAPEVYSTAVASSPVEFSENCWAPPAEVYLGLWPENRTAYDRAANIPLLANLQSENLLLLAGTNDVNTPMTYLMRLTDNLVKQNKDFSMILVPEVNHLFMRADSHATIEYWYEAIRRHFIKTLHPL